MDYRKEKNFIVAYDGDKMCGSFDFITHRYCGIKGTPIKSIPHAFASKVIKENPCFMAEVLTWIRDNRYWLDEHPAAYARLEKLVSVSLLPYDREPLRHDMKLNKEVVAYLKERYPNGCFRWHDYSVYQFTKEYKNVCEDLNESQKRILRCLIERFPDCTDYVISLFKLALRERVDYSNLSWNILEDSIMKAINIQKTIYGELRPIKHNLLTTVAILEYAEKEYRKEHLDDILKAHNDIPALYYENDTYTIYPLLTAEAFHDEASQQNNCVERMYMEKIEHGDTHVAVVRKKDNPKKSVITCEVNNYGVIIQFLKKNNYRLSNEDKELLDLKVEYTNHLTNHWGK